MNLITLNYPARCGAPPGVLFSPSPGHSLPHQNHSLIHFPFLRVRCLRGLFSAPCDLERKSGTLAAPGPVTCPGEHCVESETEK